MIENSDKANLVRTNMSTDSDVLDVIRLRYWHHLLNEMLKEKRFKIPIHLAFGHEAAAVAMDRTMGPYDALCLSHRNVAYNLARTKSLSVVLDHYNLSSPAASGGLMGSMNLAPEGTGIAYASSILGNNLAVAAGIAMRRALVRKPGVVFVLTGDGAMEEGIFWESLIFSRSHNLPLVIVVENNNCSLSSTISQRRSSVDLAKVCSGVGFRYIHAEGAVLSDSMGALGEARRFASDGSPVCVELNLSTLCQHAGPTPGWPNDPLKIALEDGLLIEDSPRDPLYHVREMLGESKFQELSAQVVRAEYVK